MVPCPTQEYSLPSRPRYWTSSSYGTGPSGAWTGSEACAEAELTWSLPTSAPLLYTTTISSCSKLGSRVSVSTKLTSAGDAGGGATVVLCVWVLPALSDDDGVTGGSVGCTWF